MAAFRGKNHVLHVRESFRCDDRRGFRIEVAAKRQAELILHTFQPSPPDRLLVGGSPPPTVSQSFQTSVPSYHRRSQAGTPGIMQISDPPVADPGGFPERPPHSGAVRRKHPKTLVGTAIPTRENRIARTANGTHEGSSAEGGVPQPTDLICFGWTHRRGPGGLRERMKGNAFEGIYFNNIE